MNKILFFACFCSLILSACVQKRESSPNTEKEMNNEIYLLVGTYTSGSSTGIYVYNFDEKTGEAQSVSNCEVSNSSYLTVSEDGKFVYSVSENNEGDDDYANSFSFDKESGVLKFLNSQPTKGKHPCYINVNQNRTFIATANYTGGNLSVFPVEADGSLQPTSQVFGFGAPKEIKNDPVSHLHSIVFSPDEKYAFAADLGKDKIHKFELNTDKGEFNLFLKPGEPASFDLEKGSGPRHLIFHPNGRFLYCINELSGKVTAFDYTEGNLSAIQYIASDTTPGVGGKGSADIHFSPDGRFLYTSNRLKADGIAIFSVNPDDGKLTWAGYQPTGIHPRNFIISPNGKYLLVANKDSNSIQLFSLDAQTGLLQNTGKEIQLDKPVCLKWVAKK